VTRATLKLEIPASPEERAALRKALLRARATELGEMRRRGTRHSLGYGDAAARETMLDETREAELRHEMLDRLIAALGEAPE
jgi:hypothetical protein